MSRRFALKSLPFKLPHDEIIDWERYHMLYVSSRKHWCCAIEDSADATFSQELVIALAYAQWVFTHMALLLGLDDILRNRQGPTDHSCAATGVQNPGHVGSLLLFGREVRRVDHLFSPALQENV